MSTESTRRRPKTQPQPPTACSRSVASASAERFSARRAGSATRFRPTARPRIRPRLGATTSSSPGPGRSSRRRTTRPTPVRSVASANRRYLFGDEPVETDWRLFTTLLRFDAVYAIHFKCSLRRIVDYPNLWPYLRDLYQRPGIAGTTRFDEIRAHYYRTHPEVNPSGLVALRPLADFDAPHEREHLA